MAIIMSLYCIIEKPRSNISVNVQENSSGASQSSL